LEQHRPRPLWQRAARQAGLAWPFGDIRRLRAMVDLLRLYQKSGLAMVARKTGVLKAMRMEQLESMLPPLREEPLISGAERWSAGDNAQPAQLFNGCVMSTVFSNVNRATGRVLARNGYNVTVPATQQCCGALHVHSGMMKDARRLAKQNIRAFEASGDAPIVVTAAGCGAALKEYDFLLRDDPAYAERAKAFSARVVDVSELLAQKPLTPPTHHVDRTVTYQEPCHLAHAQRITQQPRDLLAQIPGLELIEMKESSLCCGSAGIYNIIRKDMANDLGDRKIGHVLETGASEVVTANPGCAMQLRTSLIRHHSGLPVKHIVELLDESYGGADA
jgi:glycolate oxidase iron-sulfur subunit